MEHAKSYLEVKEKKFKEIAKYNKSHLRNRREKMEYIRSKKYETKEWMSKIMGPNPIKLEEELLLSWTPEQLDYMHDVPYWRDIVQ